MWWGELYLENFVPAVHTNTSGLADIDYPCLESSLPTLGSLTTAVPLRHTPLPPELVQEFQSIRLQ